MIFTITKGTLVKLITPRSDSPVSMTSSSHINDRNFFMESVSDMEFDTSKDVVLPVADGRKVGAYYRDVFIPYEKPETYRGKKINGIVVTVNCDVYNEVKLINPPIYME